MTEQLPQQSQDPSFDAFSHNMALMNQIVAQMKEIPQLPSEAPKDVSGLSKVEFPENGGILTYMEGHPYPYKGFPFHEFVDKIDYMKKLSRGFISGLYHSLKKKPKLVFLTLIPSVWVARALVTAGIYSFARLLQRVRLRPQMYCDAVRELHRAFTYESDSETSEDREFRLHLRDLVCMVFEFDNAYRFRFQDIMEDLSKEDLARDPIKEIIRLLEIMSHREKVQDISDTWTLIKLFVKYYIWFDKRMLKIIKTVLLRLELEKVFLSPEDIHFCKKREDYNFKHYVSN